MLNFTLEQTSRGNVMMISHDTRLERQAFHSSAEKWKAKMWHRLIFPRDVMLAAKKQCCRPTKGAIGELGVGRGDTRDQ